MRILFVHPYFPGQFARLARRLVDEGHEVVAYHRGLTDGRQTEPVPGVRLLEFGQNLPQETEERGLSAGTTRFIRQAVNLAGQARDLARAGWYPDVIYSHTGWGSTAFLYDLFPKARFVKYCEWFYVNGPQTIDFAHDTPAPLHERIKMSLMNLPILGDLASGHLLISPTEWQKAQFPPLLRPSIEVVPDGIDMAFFAPDPDAAFTLPDGRRLTRGDRIVTYVARGADPFRGFKPFLEALAILQARDPQVQALILGDRKVYYGEGHGTEAHFDAVTSGIDLDASRTHFLGKVPYDVFRDVLRVSAAHIYLTVPFVLSWSMLEAMAAGCALIGSDTAPVREFITHGDNGLLAGFFDPSEIAARTEQALAGGSEIEAMRARARATIDRTWSAELAMKRHRELLDGLMAQTP